MKNLILLSIWLVHGLVLPAQDPGTGLYGSFTVTRDGRAYKWVRIGTQVWMAENLAFLPAVSGWRRGFCGDDSGSCREEDRRYFGISVRCVKDKAP